MILGKKACLSRIGKCLIATLIAVVMITGVFTATDFSPVRAAVDKSAAQNEVKSKVTKKEAKNFVKKVAKVNKIKNILKKHSSFSISYVDYDLWIDKEKAFYNNLVSKRSIYADEDFICILEGDDPSTFYYVVDTDGRGDKYAGTNAYNLVDNILTADNLLEEKPATLVNDGKTITYTGKLSKENIEVFKKLLGITEDVKEVYSRLVVKADTYEVLEYATYSKGKEEHPEFCVQYAYDTEEPVGCCLLRRMAHRQERDTVKFSVIRDKGTEKEYIKQMTIPQNCGVMVYAKGTDGQYTDDRYTKLFEKWDRKSDITLYCRTVENSDGNADSETDEISSKLDEEYERLLPDLGPRLEEWNAELAKCSEEEKRIMKYYFITTSMNELCSIDFSLLHSYASHAAQLRENMPWTKALDEDTFLCYVASYKVYVEPVVDCRPFFYEQLSELVKGKSLTEAALLVNFWCGCQATYEDSDERAASPLGMYNGGAGRCGEEATFVVNVLRSVGIPARECDVLWSIVLGGHAFVQILVDGEWHYMGACEPDPVLDSGWFTGRLGSLICTSSYSFSEIGVGQSYIDDYGVYKINDIADFTDTKKITITVLDKAGKPAPNVSTDLMVVQPGSFLSTLVTLTTDKNGKAKYSIGKGSIYAVAYMEDEWRGTWITQDQKKATISFAEEPQYDVWESFEIRYNEADAKKVQTYTDEDWRALFGTKTIDEIRAENHSGDFDPERAAAYPDCEESLRSAGRNFDELITFLEKDDDPLRSVLVKGLSEKYCCEVKSDVLEDILQGAKKVRGELNDDIFVNGILYPVYEWSYFMPQRQDVLNLFTKKQLKKFRKDPSTLKKWFEANISDKCIRQYQNGIPSLIGTLKMGYCPEGCRTVILMELARAIGIPVYQDENTLQWFYYRENEWIVADWTFDPEKESTGKVQYLLPDSEKYLGEIWTLVGNYRDYGLETWIFWPVEEGDQEEIGDLPVGDYVMLYADMSEEKSGTLYMRYVKVEEGKTTFLKLP